MFPHFSFHPLPSTDRRWRPKVEELAPNCPRCDSSNTKFCYYNNYCLTQPRYLCKACRRYWTKGGSLRNIPVGGGCRKSRRGKSVKINSTVSSSLSPPPNSNPFRPDHALENMSGSSDVRFLPPDLFNRFSALEQQEALPMPMMMPENRAEAAPSNSYVENAILHDEFMEIQGRGFGGGMDYADNYLMGSNNYALETDLMSESSTFQAIGISEMTQQNIAGFTSLEAFL